MSARRVGFGGRWRDRWSKGEGAEAPEVPAPTTPDAPDASDDAARRQAGPAARAVIALFLLLWLAGWTYAMITAFAMFRQAMAGGDLFGTLFMGAWLAFGGVGWIAAAGVLLALLAGRPIRRKGGARARK